MQPVNPGTSVYHEFKRLYRQYLDSGDYGTFKDRAAWAIVKDYVAHFRGTIGDVLLRDYDAETERRRVNWYDEDEE